MRIPIRLGHRTPRLPNLLFSKPDIRLDTSEWPGRPDKADVLAAFQETEGNLASKRLFTHQFDARGTTATVLLGSHVRDDASNIVPSLKALFSRHRPFDADPTIHPICAINHAGSYPSGHTFAGYISAYILIQMVPEHKN
jgi:acid phosphatase (class A)